MCMHVYIYVCFSRDHLSLVPLSVYLRLLSERITLLECGHHAQMDGTKVVPCRNDTHHTSDHSLCIVASADDPPTSLMALDP